MVYLFGKNWTREALLRYVGDIKQIGGVTRICFDEGAARGLAAAQFVTGGGLNYTVLLDRCLDISHASYKGIPLCWNSCTGLHRPDFFIETDKQWLRNFFGGLLITCGLTGVGTPSEDEFGKHGLHGRATALPAEEIASWNTWTGDELEMGVQGIMQEAAVFGTFLELRRKITSHLGINSIIIEDTVTNKGYQPAPFMILYHINLGFPLVSEKAELILATKSVQPRDAEAEKGINAYNKFDVPQPNFKEQVFFHQLAVDNSGFAEATLVNLELNDNRGLGVNLRWKYDKLPYFTEWKQIGEGTYTVGLEPGNCLPTGRANESRAGRLKILQPGAVWQSVLQISILEGIEQIEAVRKKTNDLLK